jgi:hypothetical protein
VVDKTLIAALTITKDASVPSLVSDAANVALDFTGYTDLLDFTADFSNLGLNET